MANGISVVLNTLNEEKYIKRALESVSWADEIIVCDMHSDDKTVEMAKKLGAKVIYHKKEEYVELARNFAISKASYDWVFVLDPDEEIGVMLKDRLTQIANRMDQIDYVKVPRKNLIFGKWIKGAMWWPDYNIRFFRKGKVIWNNKIHQVPEILGQGLDLPAEEKWSVIHHHYKDISEFLERMSRYTKIQADELRKEGYRFEWSDLIKKPLGEFLGRFFANKGYQDGIHGLSLSLLQAFSHFVLYLRLWEMDGFKSREITLPELDTVSKQSGKEINYWFKYSNLSKNPFKKFVQKIKQSI